MRFPRSLARPLLLPILLASIGLLTSSAAAQEGEPPGRRVVTKVADEGYLWKLLAWKDGEEACQLLIGHPGLPTWEEVSLACGYETFEEWRETPPCHAAAGGDTSKCKGLYLLFAGYLEGERTVVEELPQASVTIMLEGCDVWDRSQICLQDPVLVLLGHEPLPDEHIVAIHAEVDREPHDCAGNVCRIPLEFYPGRELEIVFWAESSCGDETQRYEAWARAEAVPWPDGPVDAYWQVDVLSTQWTGPQPAACALTWRAFPPVDPDHAWLSSPPDPSGLATDQPLDLLAGRLLSWGLVEAPDCPWGGLLPNGAASPCGVEATREAVDVWQDRFDARIFEVAQETGLSARLLKRLFAQETQFWPAGFPDIAEYGLGSLHPEGGDALLLWNISFYQQFCPQVLSEETCTSPYHELIEEDQALLLGALAAQADVTCPTCPGGVNIEAAEQSVDLFAQLLLANCAQTGELVYQASRHVPGDVASYPDLWRFTLANYNAGPGCLQEALDMVRKARDPYDWSHVRQALLDLEACRGAVDYVENITRAHP